MSPSKKKSGGGKKGGGKTVARNAAFDYEALIPQCLEGDDRQLVRRFLTNQVASSEERDDALAVFAAAVIKERGLLLNEDSDEIELADTSETRRIFDDEVIAMLQTDEEFDQAVSDLTRAYENASDRPTGQSSASGGPGAGGDANGHASMANVALGSTFGDVLSEKAKELGVAKQTKKIGEASSTTSVKQRKDSASSGSSSTNATRVVGDASKASRKESWPTPSEAGSSSITKTTKNHQRTSNRMTSTSSSKGSSTTVSPIKPLIKDPQTKRVDPEIAAEIRKSVNIGWQASQIDADETTDGNIAEYCQSLGAELYNFINYPICGAGRSRWKPVQGEQPPPINVPDLQLRNGLWETYVGGHLSEWIDCDAEEEWLADLSCKELEKEIAYARYLGISIVVIELKRRLSCRLTNHLSKMLWTHRDQTRFCIVVPTSADDIDSRHPSTCKDDREMWEIWADFRSALGNFTSTRVFCGLKIGLDLDDEFIEERKLARWRAEQLDLFLVETNVFTTNPRTNGADLSPGHTRLLETLWHSDQSCAIIRGAVRKGAQRIQYAQAIRSIIGPLWLRQKIERRPNFLDQANIPYADVLQTPLQPLADNLQSTVYNTFEADQPKYTHYGDAIKEAIQDMIKLRPAGETITLYVLGAGRGPLMSAAIAAEQRVNETREWDEHKDRIRMRLVAVEKNANAIITLNYLNEKLWDKRVTVIESDMRALKKISESLDLPPPDIIVSELLGSWGDNELSPECLDGVTPFLKKDTISIPQSYTSWCAPIASLFNHQSIRQFPTNVWTRGLQTNGRGAPEHQLDGSWIQEYPQTRDISWSDQLYVTYLKQYCTVAEPKEVFTFNHPNFDNTPNTRKASVTFECTEAQDVMGFACYFTAHLYGSISLSTVPSTHTPEMLSWFPSLLPLRTLQRVHADAKMILNVERMVDDGGVWYEWHTITEDNGDIIRTSIQNEKGASYYMRLTLPE